jgi:hypothetical protein
VDANQNLVVTSLQCEGNTPLELSVRQTPGAQAAAPAQIADNGQRLKEGGENAEVQLGTGWFTHKADALPGRGREVAVVTRVLGAAARADGEDGLLVTLRPGESIAAVSAVLSDLDAPEFLSACKQLSFYSNT